MGPTSRLLCDRRIAQHMDTLVSQYNATKIQRNDLLLQYVNKLSKYFKLFGWSTMFFIQSHAAPHSRKQITRLCCGPNVCTKERMREEQRTNIRFGHTAATKMPPRQL